MSGVTYTILGHQPVTYSSSSTFISRAVTASTLELVAAKPVSSAPRKWNQHKARKTRRVATEDEAKPPSLSQSRTLLLHSTPSSAHLSLLFSSVQSFREASLWTKFSLISVIDTRVDSWVLKDRHVPCPSFSVSPFLTGSSMPASLFRSAATQSCTVPPLYIQLWPVISKVCGISSRFLTPPPPPPRPKKQERLERRVGSKDMYTHTRARAHTHTHSNARTHKHTHARFPTQTLRRQAAESISQLPPCDVNNSTKLMDRN